MIHSRIIPAILNFLRKSHDVTKSYISISCNFIIKNDVNRKITSYIYLWIFRKSISFHVKHIIALTKRECEKICFCL